MLFDFKKHIATLWEMSDKRAIVEKYSKLHPEELKKDLKSQIWYIGYVKQFTPVKYAVPHLWQDDFDWDLLSQLVAASFSSFAKFVPAKESSLPALSITVENDGNFLTKTVNELYPFQIDRLYQVYVEEQMNLQNHFTEGIENETAEIEQQRMFRLKNWNYQLDVQYEAEQALGELLVV